MTEKQDQRSPAFVHQESIINAIAVGSVFILLGVVYVIALPVSLWDQVINFFGGFTNTRFPGTNVNLPAPVNPGNHVIFYTAIAQFCLGLALMEVLVLALRLIWHSPVRRTAETTANLVFWVGASYIVPTFLNASTNANTWFAFWGAFLLVLGFSLLARAAVLLLKR